MWLRFLVSSILFLFALSTPFALADKGGKGKDKHQKWHDKQEKKHARLHQDDDAGDRRMRFLGVDRNGDGVITRGEWGGDDRSFAIHDRNGDGVLSGDEVRPGDQRILGRNRTSGFHELDHNRDGVISRSEWHDDLARFDRLDSNRDGVLTREEFAFRGRDRESLFRNLDHNNDGLIARAEWHGDMAEFVRLDANRDNLLTRDEFFRRF